MDGVDPAFGIVGEEETGEHVGVVEVQESVNLVDVPENSLDLGLQHEHVVEHLIGVDDHDQGVEGVNIRNGHEGNGHGRCPKD